MRVCICGSMLFIDAMEEMAASLTTLGVVAVAPVRDEADHIWSDLSEAEAIETKRKFIRDYLDEIRTSDAVLIANYTKNGVVGYIGANTLMEAAFAYALGKRVNLLFMPGEQACQLEAISIADTVLNGDISKIKNIP
ncbi:hypothetical protein [Pannonibacter sp.]|uniref:hypothetical protein n=1 Tax=Pannonibacter sp. TaxID=1906786 RepID=UPI003F728F7B